MVGETRSLTRRFQNEGANHVEYLSLVGQTNPEGRYEIQAVSMVTEIWTRLETGQFRVEQILRFIDLEGDLRDASRRLLILSQNGQSPVSMTVLPLRSAEAEVMEYLTAKQNWILEFVGR